MTKKIIFSALVTWFLFMPIAILNGIIRNSVYQQYTGELLGHQISTVIGSLAFIALVYIVMRKSFAGLNQKALIGIGIAWVVMTVCFEFLFGHYVAGHSWQRLLYDYNLLAGRVWALFLTVTAFTPLIVKKIVEMKT